MKAAQNEHRCGHDQSCGNPGGDPAPGAPEREQLIHWLTEEEPPEMLAATDEADRSFEAVGGVVPEEVRRKLKSWLGG